ncbi:hypothetical protein AKJ58_00940 [candidate division MSBL1 archaeon SCGC-AAA385D11]|uniref:Uncharacterized protein n=1 Tax=candidate division MSBL1 archaeon SCGC-AAA385D11 TaxID=1698286 RepID=A0A133VNX1_9EURY|nr:hypothetical protein AKJ58_00940 [candidate division MSBL1 archaeon SCGC-AAA385D11]
MKVYDEHIPEELYGKFLSRLPQVSVELFLLNDWEGKLISEIEWARKPLDLIPPAFSEQLLGLKIEKINCTELTWAEPNLEIGLKLTLTGDLVNNEESVGYPGVALEGSFEVSEASWSQTVDASFQITEEGS